MLDLYLSAVLFVHSTLFCAEVCFLHLEWFWQYLIFRVLLLMKALPIKNIQFYFLCQVLSFLVSGYIYVYIIPIVLSRMGSNHKKVAYALVGLFSHY